MKPERALPQSGALQKARSTFQTKVWQKIVLICFLFCKRKVWKSRSLVPTFETETWQSFRFPDKSGVYLESTCLTNQIFLLFLTNSEQLRFSTTKRRVTWYQISRPKLTVFRERALTSNRQTDQRGTNRIAFPPEGFWLYRVPLWPLSGDISDNACQNCPPNRVFTEYCRISPENCWISNAKLQIDFFSPITQLTMLEMIEHLTMRPFVISKFIVTWPKTC